MGDPCVHSGLWTDRHVAGAPQGERAHLLVPKRRSGLQRDLPSARLRPLLPTIQRLRGAHGLAHGRPLTPSVRDAYCGFAGRTAFPRMHSGGWRLRAEVASEDCVYAVFTGRHLVLLVPDVGAF